MNFTELEYLYDDNTLLVGSVALTSKGLEYDWFTVFVYIRGLERDVTKAFTDAEIEDFKEAFKYGIIDKHWDDLKYHNDELDEGA